MVDREMVHAIIKDNKVVVFSKTWCPHCSSTKKTFNELGVNFKLMELDKTEDGDIIQDILVEVTGARTVPRVFIGGESIGGNSDLQTLHSSGQLVPKLQKAGAL
ncbi:uncharacterized protein LOC134183678 [Corticium candelabrum]|uniref:uncharacterized protein LOC134183678 n=1 Tax=Corticium candelabrum TaxID=121492 RepID=UPI002E2630B5|nr:uncharacterized protein LOC134183678 [Corticium candelabrum]